MARDDQTQCRFSVAQLRVQKTADRKSFALDNEVTRRCATWSRRGCQVASKSGSKCRKLKRTRWHLRAILSQSLQDRWHLLLKAAVTVAAGACEDVSPDPLACQVCLHVYMSDIPNAYDPSGRSIPSNAELTCPPLFISYLVQCCAGLAIDLVALRAQILTAESLGSEPFRGRRVVVYQ